MGCIKLRIWLQVSSNILIFLFIAIRMKLQRLIWQSILQIKRVEYLMSDAGEGHKFTFCSSMDTIIYMPVMFLQEILIIIQTNNFGVGGDIATIKKRLNLLGIKIRKSSGKKLPYKDNEFDYVYNTDVIEHLVDPYSFLMESNRVLKKGGLIYCQVPNAVSIKNLKLILLGINPYVNFESWFNKESGNITLENWGGHIREINMKELRFMLEKTGFEVIATKYVSYEKKQRIATKIYPPFGYHCIAFARKK